MRATDRLLLALLLAVGCTPEPPKTDDTAPPIPTEDTGPDPDSLDQDWDGYTPAEGDCDDRDPTVNPGAEERWYDGVDQDCDGASDYDQDGDGHDVDDRGGTDCDDQDPTIHPGVEETWYDGVDQDCGGGSDYDRDGDGADAEAWGGTDCDDADPATHPGADDPAGDGVDQDCDGIADGVVDLLRRGLRITGRYDAHLAGTSVALGGDVDEDRLGDLLIGAPGSPDEALGGSGCLVQARWVVAGDLDANHAGCLVGGDDGYEVGTSVAFVGDLDDDGSDDWGVGGPRIWSGGAVMTTLYGFSGAGEVRTAEYGALGDGDAVTGYHFSRAGDLDGDGTADLAVGAWLEAEQGRWADHGALLVWTDLASREWWYEADALVDGVDTAYLDPVAPAPAGDTDGDGLDDLLVGEWRAAWGEDAPEGRVSLVPGPLDGWLALEDMATATVWGDAPGDYLGRALAADMDLDADGYQDAVLGAYAVDTNGMASGAVYVFRGPLAREALASEADAVLLGEAAGDLFGGTLDGAGDLDGDGFADVVVGASGQSGNGVGAGAVYVFLGPLEGTRDAATADRIFLGPTAGDALGTSVAGGDDVDGDGLDDLLLGAPGDDTAGHAAGAAWLVTDLGW